MTFKVRWESRTSSFTTGDDSFGTAIPRAVNDVRILIEGTDANGDACCVSIPRGSQTFQDRFIVLDGLSPGDYLVTIGGYPTNFAPADGIVATCPGNGASCDRTHSYPPSFASDPAPVTVEAGAIAEAGDITVFSLPFPVDLAPGPEAHAAEGMIAFHAVIADAVNDVIAESLAVHVTSDDGAIDEDLAIGSVAPCDDLGGAGVPQCSTGRSLEVRGFKFASTTPLLARGGAAFRVSGQNGGSPARVLSFDYDVAVDPAPPTTASTSTSTTSGPETTTTTIGATTTTTGDATTTTQTTSTTVAPTTTSSSSTTTTAPLLNCVVTYELTDTIALSALSFAVNYSAVPGGFLGSGDQVQCFVEPGIAAAGVFNDKEAEHQLLVGLATATSFSGPADVVECELIADSAPPAEDFVVTLDEAFDLALLPVSVTVAVSEVSCTP